MVLQRCGQLRCEIERGHRDESDGELPGKDLQRRLSPHAPSSSRSRSTPSSSPLPLTVVGEPRAPRAPTHTCSPAAPLSPLLAVAGTNCRGGCTRGCSKLLECLSPSVTLSFLQKSMQIGELPEMV
jgi:hypothetical protein